jgi:signal transduction histidine kinase
VKAKSISITRRLVGTLLILEFLSALALIAAVTIHERQVQLQAFDASLVAGSESLMGAVQDAEDTDDNVLLDLRTVRVGKDAVYRVLDEQGHALGSLGNIDPSFGSRAAEPGFRNGRVGRSAYRFYTLHGLRIVDPGEPNGGTSHKITVVYGRPTRHVWHEVIEEVRFFAIATAVLFGATAVLMVGAIRKRLLPVRELAAEADLINSGNWVFHAPASAKEAIELRTLARALEAALERVQRSFDQQRRFTSDAAHELKTDVAIVKSSLQLLSMRKRTAEEYSDGLAVTLLDCDRLEETVQKLLTLARLEQPESDSEARRQQCCSLREAAAEAIHQSDALAQLRGIAVTMDAREDVFVPVDRRDAVLLCSNLLVNALQHSSKQGRVQLSVAQQGGNVRFGVKDWGEGISEEDRPHLFDPFYRGDVSRSRKSGGTGLGLSICKAICDRVGGSIEIANHAEGGALVTVTIPAYTGPRVSVCSASVAASAERGGYEQAGIHDSANG